MERKFYMSGDTIISEGEEKKDVYIMLEGEALVISPEGKQVATLYKGDHFGELALMMEESKRYASCVACSIC